MARPKSLASMSVDALLKMRDEIGAVLSRKATDLKFQLSRLAAGTARGRPRKGSALMGRKVASKYRSPKGETWAGRGAQPVWLREAIKSGKKAEDFLIAKGARKSTVKKARRAKNKR
jgi:DNA-binding protein H-NS